MAIERIKQFLKLESSSAILLFSMAMLAMIWANSPYAFIHQQFIDQFLFLINECLMALFFLVVGLELKRGVIEKQFSPFSQAVLPLVSALGGMIVPALIYWIFNKNNMVTINGWAIPVATDIAFALGVLSLFNKRVPESLKLFLLALAVFDDLGAIIIIASYYSHALLWNWLLLALLTITGLFFCNFFSIQRLTIYCLLGMMLWIAVLNAGIHPTIAGVILALFIPHQQNNAQSPLYRLQNKLHPWVAFLIMPLFALANAGFSIYNLNFHSLFNIVVLGVALGLFLGKQLGVFGFSFALIQLGLAKLPAKSTWLSLYGVALLCGIGFTMSLFLGTLSFANDDVHLAEMRLGVIIGSIFSGIIGSFILLIAFAKKRSNVVD